MFGAFSALAHIENMRESTGKVLRLDGVATDISERKASNDRIEYLANYDSLTGLPNRNLFMNRLEQALTYAARCSRTVWVLFMDLDDFRTINDTFGYKAGDKVLNTMARRLRAALRESDTVARA